MRMRMRYTKSELAARDAVLLAADALVHHELGEGCTYAHMERKGQLLRIIDSYVSPEGRTVQR